jgi:nucleoside transporter
MDTAQPTSFMIRSRLFIMMLLEFFIWGAWFPLVFDYLPKLEFTTTQQSWILNALPIAAIVGMFFSNQFADRNFSAERFLMFSALAGGLAMFSLGFITSFWPFLVLMWFHAMLFIPTISITNSIAFTHLKDAQKEFGPIRMGGTIGWILAAWPFYFVFAGLSGTALTSATRWTFIVSGIASIALAIFSFALPHTPPKKADQAGTEKLAWLEAMRLLKHPFVLILWLVTFVDATVHQCYFNWTAVFLKSSTVGVSAEWVMPIMSISQVSEILTMVLLGLVLKRFGWRITMAVGILGHALRFGIYAFFPDQAWLIVAVQLLHGICYAFFFATVYMFVDAYFPKDARSSAQGLFNVMVLGIGPFVANSLGPWLSQKVYVTNGQTDFPSLFLLPCLTALAASAALALFFRPPPIPEAEPKGHTP